MTEKTQESGRRFRELFVLIGVLVGLALVVSGVLAMTGPGAPSAAPAPATSQTSTPVGAAVAQTASPTSTPTPPAPSRGFDCTTVSDSRSVTFASLAEVWAAGDTVQFCKVTGLTKSTPTPSEEGALDVYKSPPSAATTATDRELLGYIYRTCMEPDGPYTKHVHADQINEPRVALILCPEAPHAAALQSAIDAQVSLQENTEADAAAIAAGTAFPTGSYRVGVDGGIQPGTYVTESDAPYLSCYWERLDASGEIIDNNFATDVFRMEVTIAAGDYSFKTDGCGTWKLAA